MLHEALALAEQDRGEIAAHRRDRQARVLRADRTAAAEAYDYAAQVMVENMLMRDAEEGIGAFIEKRPRVAGPLSGHAASLCPSLPPRMTSR